MFRILLSIPFWSIGIYALFAAFVPRWRSRWRWTRIIAGAMAHLGFGLVFTTGGAILMFAKGSRDPVVLPLAALPLVVGLVLVLVGNWLDFRKARPAHLSRRG